MLNVLKLAALYTGIYFVFLLAYWICMVTLLVFWKPLVTFFCVIFAWFGIEYFINRHRQANAQHDEDMADWRAMNGINA